MRSFISVSQRDSVENQTFCTKSKISAKVVKQVQNDIERQTIVVVQNATIAEWAIIAGEANIKGGYCLSVASLPALMPSLCILLANEACGWFSAAFATKSGRGPRRTKYRQPKKNVHNKKYIWLASKAPVGSFFAVLSCRHKKVPIKFNIQF